MQTRTTKSLLRYAIIFFLLVPSRAIAAPFCVIANTGTYCDYYDTASCQRDATRWRGACVVNPQDTQPPSGPNPFCVVTANGGTQCNYLEIESCRRDAARWRGACVANPNRR
jgi:hypothetical protein